MMLSQDLRTDAQICGKSASQASLFVHHGHGVNRVYCLVNVVWVTLSEVMPADNWLTRLLAC